MVRPFHGRRVLGVSALLALLLSNCQPSSACFDCTEATHDASTTGTPHRGHDAGTDDAGDDDAGTAANSPRSRCQFHAGALPAETLIAGEPHGTDERMLELLAPFAGHRARGVRLIEVAGIHAPRRGPRMARRSIAGI